MSDSRVTTLADCTKLRETILARPPGVILVAFLLAVLLLASGIAWAALTEVDLVIEAPSVVRAETSEVHSGVDGEIEGVYFEVGQLVEEGEVLLRLDTTKLEERKRRVETRLAMGRRLGRQLVGARECLDEERETKLALVELRVAEAEDDLRGRESTVIERELDLARADRALEEAEGSLETQRELFDGGVVPRETLTKEEARVDDLRFQVQIASQGLGTARIERGRAARGPERIRATGQSQLRDLADRMRRQDIEIDENEEMLASLESELLDLRHDLEQCTVRAPMTGRVTEGELREGYVVVRGQRLAMVAPEELWVEAYVANADVAEIHVGQAVRIKLATYDFREYGTVAGELTHVDPDATPAGYRVEIRLASDFVGDATNRITLGMKGEAEIVTDRRRILSLAIRGFRKTTELDS